MPKVAVFTIGGTISCVYDEENGSIPTLSGEELIHEIEKICMGLRSNCMTYVVYRVHSLMQR